MIGLLSPRLQLFLEAHELYLIATDGGAIAAPISLSQLILAPGERAEVLVKGDQSPGEYRLLNQPFNPARGRVGGDIMGDRMGG
ncbi:MAG: multicopper oxidase family protein, partial [Cyanobacteria bacterium J06631_9]